MVPAEDRRFLMPCGPSTDRGASAKMAGWSVRVRGFMGSGPHNQRPGQLAAEPSRPIKAILNDLAGLRRPLAGWSGRPAEAGGGSCGAVPAAPHTGRSGPTTDR